jgi:hypothetical protein
MELMLEEPKRAPVGSGALIIDETVEYARTARLLPMWGISTWEG